MYNNDLVGRTLGEFLVEERIGRGGMATVYRAFQSAISRQVALKVIQLHDDDSEEQRIFRQRFAQEAKLVASLEHAHILPVYAYGIDDNLNVAYLAMRLLNGGALIDLLKDGPLELDRAAEIFGQVARGLAYAHSKGIVHRDLKPSNILLDENGYAFLADFGLAKWVENAPALTQTGNIVGTPMYMAPEQLRGEVSDHRADIYSMGIILYHMLVGRPPFDATTTEFVSIIYKHLEEMPRSIRSIRPEVPATVEAVVMCALEKDPDLRYDNVQHMADELDIALGRKTPSYTQNRPTLSRRPQRRPVWPWLLAGASVVLLLVIIAGLVLTNQPEIAYAEVLPDTEMTAGEIAPDSGAINRARAALGGDGFIAYITCNQTSEYHATQAREMGEMAEAYGLNYHVYDSNNDAYSQTTQIERARAEGAHALIVCPLDIELLDDPLQSVAAARLPLVLLTSDIPSYGGVLVVGDEYLMGFGPGQLAGEIIRDELDGTADVLILSFEELPFIVRRADGLVDGILSVAPDANIIGRFTGATREWAEESVAGLLADGITFDVIASINDAGSFGAINALEAADIPPDAVHIVSVDAEQLARRYIREDYYMRGSVEVGRAQFSQAAIDVVTGLLAGSTLPERVLVPPGEVITRDMLLAESDSGS